MEKFLKKVDENPILYGLVYGIAITFAGIIIYPLLDLLICKIFTHSEFIYSASQHITAPITFGLIMGIILVIVHSKDKNKGK